MSFPKYRNLRTGVKWFGDVPTHWEHGKLKRVVDPCRQITYGIVQAGPNVEGGVPYIRPADMTDEAGVASESEMLRTSEEIADSYSRSMIRTGDLVCSIGPSFGKVMVTPACLNGANLTQGTARVAIHRPNDARYFFWVLRAPPSFAQWESSVGGATFRALNLGPLAATEVLIPPPEEQQAIASFLDVETSKIDSLVAEQRRLIELLKEKRQAVISHAVTKGLNPNVSMKPSGIQWLGDVPEHWSVVPVKRLIEVKDGTHATPAYVDPSDESFPLITSKDFGETEICFDDAKYISAKDHREVIKRSNTEQGDVLMSMIGGNIGKALIVQTTRQFSIKNVALFKTSENPSIAKYLLCYLQSGLLDVQIDLLSRGSAQGFLGLGDLRNLIFFKVPSVELKQIIDALEHRVSGFTKLLAEAERAIELLQERRTALISAAVTGKIDVRGFAVQEVA